MSDEKQRDLASQNDCEHNPNTTIAGCVECKLEREPTQRERDVCERREAYAKQRFNEAQAVAAWLPHDGPATGAGLPRVEAPIRAHASIADALREDSGVAREADISPAAREVYAKQRADIARAEELEAQRAVHVAVADETSMRSAANELLERLDRLQRERLKAQQRLREVQDRIAKAKTQRETKERAGKAQHLIWADGMKLKVRARAPKEGLQHGTLSRAQRFSQWEALVENMPQDLRMWWAPSELEVAIAPGMWARLDLVMKACGVEL